MEYRYLAIDSSLANTGIAVGTIEDDEITVSEIRLHETKKSKNKQIRASSDLISRGRSTFDFIQSLIKEYDPDIIFAETPSGSQSANSMKSYGVTCQLIASLTPPPIELTPIEVKTSTVGRKTASKQDMIDWAYNKFPDLQWFWRSGKLQNKNEHPADAIAIVHAGIKTDQYKQIKRLLR